MSTVLGLPLILDDEQIEEPVTIRHDPREPGHPLHVQRDYYRPVNIRHQSAPQSGYGNPDPSMGAFGAYYGSPKPAVGTPTAAIIQTISPVAGLGNWHWNGIGLGTVALGGLAYIAIMGGAGYWLGGKLAQDKKDPEVYKWAGAISNVLIPGLGLAAVAAMATAGED